MKQENNNILKWLLAILITVVIITGGIWVYLSYASKSQTAGNNQQANIPVNTVVADWKTYENKDLGFSFKYPSKWLVEKKQFTGDLVEYLSVMVPTSGNLIDRNDPKSKISLASELIGIRVRTNDGWGKDGIKSGETVLNKTDKFVISYLIITGHTGTSAKEIYNETIPALLASFKFSGSTTSTSDWKTYENKDYGFSFEYPSDWEVNNININIKTNELLFIGMRKIGEKNDYYATLIIKKGDVDTIVKEINKIENASGNSMYEGIKNSTVGGQYASEMYFTNKTNNNIKSIITLIQRGENVFEISMGQNSSDNNINNVISKIKESLKID